MHVFGCLKYNWAGISVVGVVWPSDARQACVDTSPRVVEVVALPTYACTLDPEKKRRSRRCPSSRQRRDSGQGRMQTKNLRQPLRHFAREHTHTADTHACEHAQSHALQNCATLYVRLSVCLSVSLCLCVCLSLSVSVCLCLCLSVSVCLSLCQTP